MATRNVSMTLQYIAWDTSANTGKTGDGGNHTLRWVKDGTAAAPTNSLSEVDATNAPGVYKVTLTATETDCNVGTLCGVSSTGNVVIMPITLTFERLPDAAPGSNGGVPTVDASNYVAGVQGTKNTLDDLNDIAATDVVTGPAIATSTGGVVDNVALVDLVTLIDTNGIAADSLSTGALADINGEVDTALSDINLDHLAAASATLGTDVDDDSIIGQIISSSAVSGYDRTLHSLEVSGDKTQLITSAGVTAVVGLISDGDTFEVTRGKALTGIELTVPTSTIDLSGYNATFGVTRIATDNAVTSDTAAEQFNFTITDPGGAGQKITGSIPKTSTANWTLDNDMVVETFTPTGRAYRWSIDINNSHTGTAQAGASSTITLAADASDDDDFYNGVTVEITGGTGSGQTKTITDYVGSTRVATVDSSWASNPDNTSVYHVAASDTGCVPLAKGEISVTAADTNCGQPS